MKDSGRGSGGAANDPGRGPGGAAHDPGGGRESRTVRVELPTHLAKMADAGPEVAVPVEAGGDVSYRAVFDALEDRFPMLRGTIRDPRSGERRPYMRYFAERRDLSHENPDAPLPDGVVRGRAVLRVVGAIAGG